MKKLSILTGIILLINMSGLGQAIPNLKNYSFKTLPRISEAEDTLYAKDKVLGLYYGRIFDYRLENNRVELWECLHIASKVYESRIVQQYNIFYLPTNKIEDIIDCGARYIARDGSVSELSKKDIEEIEEDGKKYKVFRFPTAEIGSTMEYYYIVRRERVRELGTYYMPSNYHQKELDFTLIFPNYLNFEMTTYNGLPVAKDTLDKESKIKCIYVHAEEVPKVNDDPMAFYDAHLPRIEFLLTHNYSKGRMRINTVNDFASGFYQNVTLLDKKETKDLKKIASQIKADSKLSLGERINVIENYVKTNFKYTSGPSFLSNISAINESKFFNQMGALRLFYHLFKQHNINTEIVLTSDKTDKWFDKNFNGSNYFDLILIYFPKIDQYMSPNYMGLRTGYPAAVAAGQEGISFKEMTIGNTSSFLHDVKYITPVDMKDNGDTIYANVSINPEEREISATIRRVLTGYSGGPMQYQLSNIDKDNDDDDSGAEYISSIEDHYLGLSCESIIVNNLQMFNATKEDVLAKPLILTADLKDNFLTKTSNDSLWVTIGAFIGKQSDFKQEAPRTLPVERRNNTHYYRMIKVDIPQGYTCLNLHDLNMDIYDEGNKANANAKFTVSTKQEGNQLIIVCEEFYNRLLYPVEEYEKCQRVVQAAADFNNKVLLFKKQ